MSAQGAERPGSLYASIKQQILTGELGAGQRLVASTMAVAWGVSRTPVREALQRLEQDGLVERTGAGMQVRGRSAEELVQIYEARMPLEEAAAAAAAERHTRIDVLRLEDCLNRYVGATAHQVSDVLALDGEFHRALWEASHNDVLVDLLTRLRLHLGRYPVTALHEQGRHEASVAEHRQLLDAVLRHDRAEAGALGRAHMNRALEIRLTHWHDDRAPQT